MTKNSIKIYQNVLNSWEIDKHIDEIHLDKSCLETPNLHGKYLTHYANAASMLKEQEQELATLRHQMFKYYSGKMSKEEMDALELPYDPFEGGTKPLKSELHKWIDNNQKVKDLTAYVEEISLFKEIVKEILESIRWRGNLIKNIIDFRKFQAGL